MTSYGWEEGLRLSIQPMDDEHRAVLEAASRLRDAVDAGAPKHELETLLAAFLECAGNHFASEERLMRAHAYGLHPAHQAEHERLLGQVRLVRDEFGAGQIHACDGLSLFLEVWTRQHITGPDAAFARFLKARPAVTAPA